MKMSLDHNPLFGACQTNLNLALSLSRVMQENRQRVRTLEVQTAERMIDATKKMVDSVASAQDWPSLATLSTSMMHKQAEVAAGFWQDLFSVAAANQVALLDGVRDATGALQSRNSAAIQGAVTPGQANSMMQAMIKPFDMLRFFEPFMNATTAYGKPAGKRADAKGAEATA
jgi:beta-phosphoglucomutase-like phosphatase (HAD superfamily)